MANRVWTLVALAVLAASACGPHADEARRLADARRIWGDGPAAYSFNFRWGCFCSADFTDTVRVTVTNHAITDVTSLATGIAVPKEKWSFWMPVEGLFDLIDEAITRPAEVLEVQFDASTGFPLSFSADYSRQIADEERSFTATGPFSVP